MALASVNVRSSGGGGGVIYLSTPEQTGSLTYNGSEQSPAWLNYSSEQMLIGGTPAATDAGTYTATFTPQGLCAWTDGTSNTKQVTWTIAKAAVNLSASIDGAVGYDSADNNIIRGGFKTALTSGKDVALCDSKLNTGLTDGTICFNIGATSITAGGRAPIYATTF